MLRHFGPAVQVEPAAPGVVRRCLGEKSMAARSAKSGYVSEFEQFMDAYLRQHPGAEEERMRGWYIWWDHRVDLDELDEQKKSAVPVKPYQYE